MAKRVNGVIVFILCLYTIYGIYCISETKFDSVKCDSDPRFVGELRDEIRSKAGVVNTIVNEVVYGSQAGVTYQELADFADKFGPRMTGTATLENAIDFMVSKLNEEGLEDVHTENVPVPRWMRGTEYAVMTKPRYQQLQMLGLGSSVSTPPDGIKAALIVVNSFEELWNRLEEADRKIVLFNFNFTDYHEQAHYRRNGASEAAKVGAVAALVRSLTPFSIGSPHTGQQDYAFDVPKIPVASISVEDADMLQRMANRGKDTIL